MKSDEFQSSRLARWERIDDEIFDISPLPTEAHQRIVGNLFLAIGGYLKGERFEEFDFSPFSDHI